LNNIPPIPSKILNINFHFLPSLQFTITHVLISATVSVFIAFLPIYPRFAFHQKRIIKKLVLLMFILSLSPPPDAAPLHNYDNSTRFASCSVPQVLVLNDCGIDQAGEAEDLKKKCYTVKELDLAQNKLENWNEVKEFLMFFRASCQVTMTQLPSGFGFRG
jgi:hypothetical protein